MPMQTAGLHNNSSLQFLNLLRVIVYSGKSVHIICNKATNGRPYGLSVIYRCRLQNNISKSLSALTATNDNYKVKS